MFEIAKTLYAVKHPNTTHTEVYPENQFGGGIICG